MSSIPDNLKGGISSLPSSVKPVQSAASGAKIGDTLGAGIGTLVPCVTNANASLSVTPTSGGGGGGGSYPANPLVSSILIQGGKISYDSNASVMIFSPASISSIYVSSVNGQPIGGGGGGSNTPNPVVSTLTFSKGDETTNTNGTLLMNTLLAVRDPNVLSPQNFNFQFATSNNTNAYPSFYQNYLSTFNGISIWAPDSNVINTGLITIASSVDGRSAIVAQSANGALSTLSILADTVQVPNNLQVSTINGNVPALTSAKQNDIAQLFNNLFLANPSLSTIVI